MGVFLQISVIPADTYSDCRPECSFSPLLGNILRTHGIALALRLGDHFLYVRGYALAVNSDGDVQKRVGIPVLTVVNIAAVFLGKQLVQSVCVRAEGGNAVYRRL